MTKLALRSEAVQRLRTADLEGLLAFLGESQSVDGPEPFTTGLLDRLGALVGCELVTYNQLDPIRRRVVAYVACSNEGTPADEPLGEIPEAEAAIMRRRQRDRNGTVCFLSDRLSRARRLEHDYPLADYGGAAWGVVDNALVKFPMPSSGCAAVVFESVSRDFNERDRAVLEQLRAYLPGLWRSARVRRRLEAALTALEHAEAEGKAIVLIGGGGEVERATPTARRLLADWFAADGDRLPGELDDWLRKEARRSDRPGSAAASPFVASRPGRRLVVDAAGPGLTTLLLAEHSMLPVPLTRREWDVMRCVAAGRSTEETARLLFVEPSTVRKHLEHVFAKLGVGSRTAAVARLRPALAEDVELLGDLRVGADQVAHRGQPVR